MPHSLRAVAFLACVCVLYVLGYIVLSAVHLPWGLAWLPVMAVAAGALWHALERLDARLLRRDRNRDRQG
jgi:hypothetical protein